MMSAIIDWYSFTFETTPLKEGNAWMLGQVLTDSLSDAIGGALMSSLWGALGTVPMRGRAPYAMRWDAQEGGISVFGSPSLPHALVEISGTGCERLRGYGVLDSLIAATASSCSRLDLAADMPCSERPSTFITAANVDRFVSRSVWESGDGETCYLGSMKSERYARVYRYNPPHPRSHLLRAEHVFRKRAAKAAVDLLLSDGIHALTVACGAFYGWQSENWQTVEMDTAPELGSGQTRKKQKNTAYWLYTQVAHALKKQVKLGDVELDHYIKFLQDFVRGEVGV
jgi:hypothetical protein